MANVKIYNQYVEITSNSEKKTIRIQTKYKGVEIDVESENTELFDYIENQPRICDVVRARQKIYNLIKESYENKRRAERAKKAYIRGIRKNTKSIRM